MYIPKQSQNTGMFLATTKIWNATRINALDVNSPDFKVMIVDLYQNINDILITLNKKESALYPLTEFVTGGQWYNPDPTRTNIPLSEYRITVNFGALGVATKSVPHGINWTTSTVIVDIQCIATKTTAPFSALHIPYASSVDVAHNVELFLDATHVTISNGIDRRSYNTCNVVIAYLQG